MIFIIGGYAQGKREYALNHYKDADKHIMELNDWAREQFEAGIDPLPLIKTKITDDPDLIIISDMIGNGVVPESRPEREFRDSCGRLQVEIAKLAGEVIRVTCGLGQKIK